MAHVQAIRRSAHPASRRTFATTSTARASILFALGALSNSRETQHFNKLSRLQRVEHSPPLKLIKTSEIDPFPLPEPPRPIRPRASNIRSSTQIWDARALQAGRAILRDNARYASRMRKALDKAKTREAVRAFAMGKERVAWAKERQRMRAEMRAAGVWILLSVGTATGLAMWRFWPQNTAPDSGDLGRKLAARAKGAMPVPSITERVSAAVASPPIGVTAATTTTPLAAPNTTPKAAVVTFPRVEMKQEKGWWKGLFWKQQ